VSWKDVLLNRVQAIEHIEITYGYDRDRATRCVDIAIQIGKNWPNSCPVDDGFFIVRFVGLTSKGFRTKQFTIEPPLSHQKVAAGRQAAYTPTRKLVSTPSRPRGEIMPPRGRTAQVDAEPAEAEETERDYTIYATKDVTATMEDFAEWIVQEVYEGDQKAFDKEDPVRIVSLAGTLRMEFQRSDLNKTRRAERQAARAAGNGAEADEDEAAPITPAKRTAAKPRPGAAKPGRTAKAGATKPAARRGRAPAAAEAPY
jgi:hypothetical protein